MNNKNKQTRFYKIGDIEIKPKQVKAILVALEMQITTMKESVRDGLTKKMTSEARKDFNDMYSTMYDTYKLISNIVGTEDKIDKIFEDEITDEDIRNVFGDNLDS